MSASLKKKKIRSNALPESHHTSRSGQPNNKATFGKLPHHNMNLIILK